MAAEKQIRKSPGATFLEALFGKPADLETEELDALYSRVAGGEDPRAVVTKLAARSAERFHRLKRKLPSQLQACIRQNEAWNKGQKAGTIPAELTGTVAPSAPGSTSQRGLRLRDKKEITAADKEGIDDLARRLSDENGDTERYIAPAAQLAGVLLDRFRIAEKPDLDSLCSLLGLRVAEEPFEKLDGVLLRSEVRHKGIIGINASIRDVSHKRFTVAHEIAHFIIPHHRRRETVCKSGQVESFSPKLATPEFEANEFATALLLPAKAVRRQFDLDKPSLWHISLVAKEFETSLIATTSRYLALTKQPCAMVWSRSGRVAWYRTSDTLSPTLLLDSLPARRSNAGRLFAGESLAPGMREVDAALWFHADRIAPDRTVFEDSIYSPAHDSVFTLLWIASPHADVAHRPRKKSPAEIRPDGL